MRRVNYIVKQANGSSFITTDYSKATTEGNRIVKTFLTEINDTTEEQREAAREHARKYRGYLAQRKRG